MSFQGEIDFCVCLSGDPPELQKFLIDWFLETFKTHIATEDVSLWLVDRLHKPAPSFVIKALPKWANVVSCPLLPLPDCGSDTAAVCDWMVDHCGASPWVVIAHYDIVFQDDVIRYVRSIVGDKVGVINSHSKGLVAVNRKAYNVCRVGFTSLDCIKVVHDDHDNYRVRSIYDGFPGTSNILLALDVGELLDLRMAHMGFGRREIPRGYFTHLGNGSGHGMTKEQRDEFLARVLDARHTGILSNFR